MDIRPIRNEEDRRAALQEIERLWNAEPGTDDGDKLDILATLVERYEGHQVAGQQDAQRSDRHAAFPDRRMWTHTG